MLAENKLDDRAYELNFAAARLAREVADEFSTRRQAALRRRLHGAHHQGPQRHRRHHLRRSFATDYYEQAKGLVEGGADFLLIETCFDTRQRQGRPARDRATAARARASAFPSWSRVTIERMGTMLAGQTVDALYASIAHADLLSVGLNCATGPEFMTDHIRTLHEMASHAHLLLSERRAAE